MSAVLVDHRDGGIAVVRLNRPQALNAINEDIRRALPPALAALNADRAVRAVVIAGAGERAFSAGQDLAEGAGYTIDDVDRWFTELHAAYAAVRALDKPTVAAVVGVAAGAGYQIALYCDLRVTHAEARIGQPEVKTGLGSILGTSLMMWHLPFGINAELSLTGELISGERAYQLGLVNALVAREAVLDQALARARLLAERPPHAIRITKQRMRELTQAQFDDILVAAKRYQRLAYESGEPQRTMPRLMQAMQKGKRQP
ncbi:MAG TPA: enoyl-CoA hydratase/isomerase family protein [Burkholderiales bacterium]|nr:enoyl-CoA hydratase/isomerase family protein [Burkholderiales bacterium]